MTIAMVGPVLTNSPMQMSTGVFMRKESSFLGLRCRHMVSPLFICSKCLCRRKPEPCSVARYGVQQSDSLVDSPARVPRSRSRYGSIR